MSVVDHEQVVHELESYIVSRPHHGSRDLTLKLAELKAQHTLDEHFILRALRVYGFEALIALVEAARDSRRDDRGGSPSPAADGEPDHRPPNRTEEVHDGNGSTQHADAQAV